MLTSLSCSLEDGSVGITVEVVVASFDDALEHPKEDYSSKK